MNHRARRCCESAGKWLGYARVVLGAIGFIAFSTLFVVSAWFLFRPSPSTFSIEAQTESITFFPADAELAIWRLFDVAVPSLTLSPAQQSPRGFWPEAELSIACGTRVSLERVGHGPIRISLTQPLHRNSVGIIEFASEREPTRIDLGQEAVLVMRTGEADTPTPVLPLRGRVFVGSDASSGRVALLHSGRLTVLGETLLSGTRYTASETTLHAGDRVELPFDSSATCEQGLSKIRAPEGFLRAASDPDTGGLQVVLYAPAAGAYINRLGRPEEVVWATLWEPFKHDPILSGLVIFLGLILAALACVPERRS